MAAGAKVTVAMVTAAATETATATETTVPKTTQTVSFVTVSTSPLLPVANMSLLDHLSQAQH